MLPRSLLLLLLAPVFCSAQMTTATPEQLAAQFGLTASTTLSFPQPTATASLNASTFLAQSWGITNASLIHNPQNLAFVDDPFPNSSVPSRRATNSTTSSNSTSASSPVLRVNYPASGSSGTQFLALYNGSTPQEALIASYEVAFSTGFNFVNGGTLPGMRGGPSTTECNNNNASTGHNCFSARVRWRPQGAGELFAYIPQSTSLCQSNSAVVCNTTTGAIDIDRGAFSLTAGQWMRVTMFTWMNGPASNNNGLIAVYLNDVQVVNKTELQIRGGTGIAADGLWFSTEMLGGNPPADQQAFFRNVQLWSGNVSSNIPNAQTTTPSSSSSPSGGSKGSGSHSRSLDVLVAGFALFVAAVVVL